jgi:hypothetical protein
MPVYNFLEPSNIKVYFDSLLYNYSLHRKKYLSNICSNNNNSGKEEKLINELNQIINVPKAKWNIYNFGLFEDFCLTLCNWPGENTENNIIDIIFFPFYRWGQRIKDDPILNFTQIAIILGELPMPFESLLSLNEKDYKKSMDLIFDINENLFNDIFYLYYKVGKNGTISCKKYEYFKKPHSIQEIERVFINYILFSLLINKSFGYKYSQFYQTSYGQLIKDLLNLFDYNNDKYEKEQETFPYKIILTIFEKHNKSITKLLKILWIKKLYPLSLYSLKKLGFLTDDENLKIQRY